MKITVNGKVEKVVGPLTIEQLLQSKGLVQEQVVVEVNLNIVKKEHWGSYIIKENDTLEVLRFVGGG